jgi:adenylosuccinate lyase
VIARYARPAMAKIWSDESRLARWLDVELAALDGWAEIGAVPAEDVAEIRAHARPPTPERVAEIERVTDHDVAAFVDAVAEQLGAPGRWVHHGLTSSDVVDTALSLQIQDAGRLVLDGIDRTLETVVAQAEKHRTTICIGRSHGIHAEPTTFGWKLAGWAFERALASPAPWRQTASASSPARSGRTHSSIRRWSGSRASASASSRTRCPPR